MNKNINCFTGEIFRYHKRNEEDSQCTLHTMAEFPKDQIEYLKKIVLIQRKRLHSDTYKKD